MEDRSVTHNVENYFSYDAPQQGANIPLGLQYIFKEVVRDAPYLKFNNTLSKLDDAFNSAAARQMLVTYADYDNSAFNWFPKLNTLNPLRAAFAARLKNKGYPQQTNNYGIALGRGNNTAATKDAGNGNQFTAVDPFGPQTQIFGGSVGFLLVNAEAEGYAVSENNNKATIAYYSFTGLTFRKIFGLPIVPVLTLRVRRFDYTGQNPYDDGQGSFEQTQTEFANYWIPGLGMPGTTLGHDGHNFVATVSALDLQNQTYDATNKWQSSNIFYNIDNQIQNPGQVNGNTLITPSLSPFDAVMTSTSECAIVGCSAPQPYLDENGNWIFPSNSSEWNHYHNTAITFQVARFIERNILNAQPVDCAGGNGLCNATPDISGPGIICTNGQYQLTNPPNGVTINWEIQNGYLKIGSGQGTPVITVIKQNTGYETVKVTLTNTCGASLVLTKNVTVGTPSPLIGGTFNDGGTGVNQPLGNTYNEVYNQTVYVSLCCVSQEISWQENSSTGNVSWYHPAGPLGAIIYFGTPPPVYYGDNIDFSITRTNQCGVATEHLFFYYAGATQFYRIAPNPVNTSFTLTQIVQPKRVLQNDKKAKNIDLQKIQIVDKMGNIVFQKSYSNAAKSDIINISALKSDLYTVRVFTKDHQESHKIVVEH